jgi:hypothetical protein
MHVIRHEAISPYLNSTAATPFRHDISIGFVVIIVEKRRLSTISSLRYVMGQPSRNYPGNSSHDHSLFMI